MMMGSDLPAWVRAGLAVVLSVASASAFAVSTYTCERLEGKADAVGGKPEAINARGEIAGLAFPSNHPEGTAYRWSKNLVGRRLAQMKGRSDGYAINDSGHVAGLVVREDGSYRAVLWADGAEFRLRGLAGSHGDAWALGINATDQIVGESVTTKGQWHATLWDHGSTVDLADPDDAQESGARHVNDDGVAVGFRWVDESHRHAMSWDHGVTTDLGVLEGGDRASAWASNHHGTIVGVSNFAGGDSWMYHAVAWRTGGMIDLGQLPGHVGSYAVSVNDAGVIVGTSETLGATLTATVWLDLSSKPVDLNSLVTGVGCIAEDGLPARLEWATGINRHGQIAAFGAGTGFRLTPQ